jgi:hypothetical protein
VSIRLVLVAGDGANCSDFLAVPDVPEHFGVAGGLQVASKSTEFEAVVELVGAFEAFPRTLPAGVMTR